jgi:hypothetical protein
MEPSGLASSRPKESAETEQFSQYCQRYCNNPPIKTTFSLFSEIKTVIYTTKSSRSKIIFHNPVSYLKYPYIDKRHNFTTTGIPTTSQQLEFSQLHNNWDTHNFTTTGIPTTSQQLELTLSRVHD